MKIKLYNQIKIFLEVDMSNNSVDKNLRVETKIDKPDIKFYDVREEPFKVFGLYNYKNEKKFKRLPDEIGLNTNEGVADLYCRTAGGRVRFKTNSKYVAIKTEWSMRKLYTHMALTCSVGFDLYIDAPNTGLSRFYKTFVPPADCFDGYESVIDFPDDSERYITINFPTYNEVTNLYIGLQESAELGAGKEYAYELPVVYYGSSITQGGCATRPGNTYQAILSRRLDMDYINLGFSGSGRGEDIIVDYMASLPMLAFVSDYDHNASLEGLRETHLKMYKKIREKHPDIPYIMMSKADVTPHTFYGYDDAMKRKIIIFDTFRYAHENGDRNVYFIDGEGIYRGPYADGATVDGIHPTDLGFSLIAEAYEKVFEQIIVNGKI